MIGVLKKRVQLRGVPGEPKEAVEPVSSAYKKLLLILLMVILAFTNADRVAFSVVLQALKVDLHLSDTQLGILMGTAFFASYAMLGIPIARWADRGNRARILTIFTLLSSVLLALCGRATSFVQLLLLRVGLGAGESGCIPTSNSLISDYFARAERPRALAIYGLGWPLSSLCGFSVVGWVSQHYGWRLMFFIIALPGIVLSVLSGILIREPRAIASGIGVSQDEPQDASDPCPSLREVISTLLRSKTFVSLFKQYCTLSFVGYAVLLWTPSFLVRSYGLSPAQVGYWMALTHGLLGMVGTYVGGFLSSRYLPQRERAQFLIMMGLYAALALLLATLFAGPPIQFVVVMGALAALFGSMVNGPLIASWVTLVPPRMRAMAVAILFLGSNLVGACFGPLAIGAISDALQPHFRAESLRYTMLIFSAGYLWPAYYLWRASQTVERDLAALKVTHSESGLLA